MPEIRAPLRRSGIAQVFLDKTDFKKYISSINYY